MKGKRESFSLVYNSNMLALDSRTVLSLTETRAQS